MILMEDEAGFYRQPTVAGAWGRCGRQQPRIAMSHDANRSIRAAVAFDPVTGRVAHRLRSSFSAVEMGRFYRFVSRRWARARTIYLVMDNWPVHHHLRAWQGVEADERLKVLWLPTYAPWLNPAEKIWKWVRQRLIHMHPYAEAWSVLRRHLDDTLASINDVPQAILRYTGTGKATVYSS